jgi:hypothetical protein
MSGKQLHAETNAQNRLPQTPEQICEPGIAQFIHSNSGSANPGQYDMARRFNARRVGGKKSPSADAIER